MSGYVKIFKNKDGDKDKNKNNKLMFFHGADDKLLKNIKSLGLRLKTYKILNWMLHQFMMIDMMIKLKQEHMVIKFILIFAVEMWQKVV